MTLNLEVPRELSIVKGVVCVSGRESKPNATSIELTIGFLDVQGTYSVTAVVFVVDDFGPCE
jgi:hypothetical protein